MNVYYSAQREIRVPNVTLPICVCILDVCRHMVNTCIHRQVFVINDWQKTFFEEVLLKMLSCVKMHFLEPNRSMCKSWVCHFLVEWFTVYCWNPLAGLWWRSPGKMLIEWMVLARRGCFNKYEFLSPVSYEFPNLFCWRIADLQWYGETKGWNQKDLLSSLVWTTVNCLPAAGMAKSSEVKLAIFGRAGVGKSGKIFAVVVCVCVSLSPVLLCCSFRWSLFLFIWNFHFA